MNEKINTLQIFHLPRVLKCSIIAFQIYIPNILQYFFLNVLLIFKKRDLSKNEMDKRMFYSYEKCIQNYQNLYMVIYKYYVIPLFYTSGIDLNDCNDKNEIHITINAIVRKNIIIKCIIFKSSQSIIIQFLNISINETLR